MEDRVIVIEKMVFGGKGLSRDLHKVAFVPFTLPGERVRVRIKREHRDYLEAEAIEIVASSTERVSPECRYFGRCGGCQISHASYEAQVQLKKETLLDTLKRNHLEVPQVDIITAEPFGYRHRAQLKFDAARGYLGFYELESHQVVDIQECLCLTPGLNRLLTLLRNRLPLRRHETRNITEIDCYENEKGRTAAFFNAPVPDSIRQELNGQTRVFDPNDVKDFSFTVAFGDQEFPMRPDIFLQVNPKLWKAMIQEVQGHHEPGTDRTALELYCGSGFFTLPLTNRFAKIFAVEESEEAIRFAEKEHSTHTIEWINKKAEHVSIPAEATVLIVDPPRAGLHKRLIEPILNHPFEKISYISCDCSSFARDARALSRQYRISRLTMLDLFPQTFHFETIALLERSA